MTEHVAAPLESRLTVIPNLELSAQQTISPPPRAPLLAQPLVTPYVEPAARAAAETPGAPPPAPTIRVTIGRIDVRALMQPLPRVPRAAPPVAKLSLEEYLRQRSGGKS